MDKKLEQIFDEEILRTIAEDMKNDAAAFDGKPFNGKTVAQYFGYHGAAIAAIADKVVNLLEVINSRSDGKSGLPKNKRVALFLYHEGYSIRKIMKFLEYKSPRSVQTLLKGGNNV